MTMPRKLARTCAFVLILLLAFVVRIHHLDFQSIWWDEGHSIEMASAPLSQIATLPGMDVHPPGYFMLLHEWMIFAGPSEFALRFLSLLFSLLGMALLMRFAADLARQTSLPAAWTAGLTGLLAAIYPLSVAYAQEVRMYALIVFLMSASFYAQWRLIAGRRLRPGLSGTVPWIILYVLATAASLYTHYFAIFLVAFQNLAWLMWVLLPSKTSTKSGARLGTWGVTQVGTLILFAPQLPLALGQTTAYANPNLNPPALFQFLSRSWRAYSIGPAIYAGVAWLAPLAAVFSAVVVLVLVWRARQRRDGLTLSNLGFVAGWFVVPLALYYLVLQVRPSFEPRYLTPVTPALLLLWGWGTMAVLSAGRQPKETSPKLNRGVPAGSTRRPRIEGSTGSRLVAAAALAVIAVALGWGSVSYFTNESSFKDDSQAVVNWLAAETTGDDVVYVDVPHPFHYYAERIPAPTRYLFVDVHTAASTLNAEAGGKRRLYWVTWWGSDTDPRGIIPFLLDKVGRRSGEKDFRGYHVTWWTLPEDSLFSLPADLEARDVTFGDVIRLDGTAFPVTAQSGKSAWLTAHYSLLKATDVDYRASVRLRDSEGNMLPPIDKDILNDRHFRTSAWPVDDPALNQAVNVYTLPIPDDVRPGDYQMELVVYDAVTLEALPVNDPSSPDGISARLGTLNISP